MKEKIEEEIKNRESNEFNSNFQHLLILHNDEIHTFDEVIDALIKICNHETEQAVQCTYLVHYKGKADVKKGNIEALKPMRQKLSERGLRATIE